MSAFKEYSMLFMLNASLGSDYKQTFNKAQAEIAEMQNEIQQLSKTQSDISAYQRQQAAVESSRKKLENLRQQYDNIQKELKETENASSALENKGLRLKYQIDKTTDALEKKEDALKKLEKSLDDAGVDTNNLADETQRLESELKDVKQAQEEAKESANELENAYSDITEAISALGAIEALKEIAEWTRECVQASIEYESALTGVYKTVDGTDEQLTKIDRDIKQLSTDIPATTEEIAAVAEAAGQLGIKTDDVMDFTRVMIDLGESTNLSAEEAASSLAKFANITGMEPEYYSNLGSVIVGLGNNFATTEADIVAMGTRLASAGKLAGFTEAEIMALAASMSSVGIEAEAGGTAMTQTFNAIEVAVAEKGKDLKKFAKVAGMSSKEFATAWETAPMTAVQAFMTGVGKLEEQGESAVLVLDELGLSGIRQSNMIKSLGLASDTLANAVSLANGEWEKNTALSEEANKRYSTTESKLKMLENSYKNMQIAIGDVFNPAIAEGADVLNELLQGVTEFVEENPDVVAAIGSIAAGLGTLSGSVVLITGGMKAATAATKLFAAAQATAFWPVAVVAGVATAIGVYAATVTAATEEEQAATKERERLKDATEDLRRTQIQLNETLESNVGNIEANVYTSEILADKLDTLMGVENKSAAQKQEMANVVEQLNSIYPDLNLNYDKESDALRGANGEILTNTQYIRDNIAALKEQAIAQVYMEDYVARLKEEKEAMENYNQAQAAYDEAVRLKEEFVGEHFGGSYTLFDMIDLAQLNEGIEEAKNILGAAGGAYAEAQAAASQAWDEYEGVINRFTENTEKGAEAVEKVADEAVEKVAKDVEKLDQSEAAAKSATDTMSAYAKGITDSYPKVAAAYANVPKLPGTTISAAPQNKYASGTDSAKPGISLVGEEGPELVYFGGGEKVFTADETKSLLQSSVDFSEMEQSPSYQKAKEIFNYGLSENKPVSMQVNSIDVPAAQSQESNITITIAPQFNIEGGNVEGLDNNLEYITNLVKESVLDALDEAGINKKRSVYA